MGLVQQFLKSFRQEDDLVAGLFQKNDGTVWLRNPDGSETQVGGGGGGGVTLIVDPDETWQSDTAYALGGRVTPSSLLNVEPTVFEATTAGTSGDSEPDWTAIPGTPIDDGTVVWAYVGIVGTVVGGRSLSGASGNGASGSSVTVGDAEDDGTGSDLRLYGGDGATGHSAGDVDITGGRGDGGDVSPANFSVGGGKSDGTGGGISGRGGPGGLGDPGGSVALAGARGNDDDSPGASLTLEGGHADGSAGVANLSGAAIQFGGTAFVGEGVPEVPAIPTAQDIVDALIASGILSQAS